jgi:C-terminal processing protease CtpA/Prc
MTSFMSRVITILLLVSTALVSGQTRVIIYDGYTGIYNTHIQLDTARVVTLIPRSPAERAGIRLGDQIIAINDSVIAGTGAGRRDLQDLLFNKSGEPIDLLIRRKGEDSLLHFSFNRGPYLNQIN